MHHRGTLEQIRDILTLIRKEGPCSWTRVLSGANMSWYKAMRLVRALEDRRLIYIYHLEKSNRRKITLTDKGLFWLSHLSALEPDLSFVFAFIDKHQPNHDKSKK